MASMRLFTTTGKMQMRRGFRRKATTLGSCVDFIRDFDPVPQSFEGPRLDSENDQITDKFIQELKLFFAQASRT